jgi:hypothetical protein
VRVDVAEDADALLARRVERLDRDLLDLEARSVACREARVDVSRFVSRR